MSQEKIEGIYIVRGGDTLSKIAARELGSARRYPEIVSMNPRIKNPDRIYEADFLFLPPRFKNIHSDLPVVTPDAVADLQEASDYFKQMPQAHQQALMDHGESTGLIAGILAELDGQEAYKRVLTGASTVKNVTSKVHQNAQAIAKTMLAEIDELKRLSPPSVGPNLDLERRIIEIQARASGKLSRLVGQEARGALSGTVDDTYAIRSYVQGNASLPGQYTEAVKNSDKWVGRMRSGATILVALNLAGSTYECVKDFQDSAEDLRSCAGSLGSFVGGATAGMVGAAILGGLTVGGLPLIGAVLLIAAGGMAASSLFRDGSQWLYDVVN